MNEEQDTHVTNDTPLVLPDEVIALIEHCLTDTGDIIYFSPSLSCINWIKKAQELAREIEYTPKPKHRCVRPSCDGAPVAVVSIDSNGQNAHIKCPTCGLSGHMWWSPSGKPAQEPKAWQSWYQNDTGLPDDQ